MIRTYDIADEDMIIIKDRLRSSPFAVQQNMADRLKPVCDSHERLVLSAQAFRDFHSDGDEDQKWALEQADDNLINTFLDAENACYDTWAKECDSAMTELMHHLSRLARGEGGLSLPDKVMTVDEANKKERSPVQIEEERVFCSTARDLRSDTQDVPVYQYSGTTVVVVKETFGPDDPHWSADNSERVFSVWCKEMDDSWEAFEGELNGFFFDTRQFYDSEGVWQRDTAE